MNSLIKIHIKTRPRILVVRPDRIGDVILSTPVLQAIKERYRECRLGLLIQSQVRDVVGGLSEVDDLLVYEPNGIHRGLTGLWKLVEDIKKGGYEVAVCLQNNPWVSVAIFLAGVRHRIGPLSKWHSYFLFNAGIQQSRSQVLMHEAEYNLMLLSPLDIEFKGNSPKTKVAVSEGSKKSAQKWFEKEGGKIDRKLIAIHPGMGGSALNWPESQYLDLIKALVQDGHQILITGGPAEGALIRRFQSALKGQSGIFYYPLQNKGGHTLDHLSGFFQISDLVVAPSTGPLHLAVALGRPVLGFYPPVRVQSAKRWGPFQALLGKSKVMTPSVSCPGVLQCLGSTCEYYNCMKNIRVSEVRQEVRNLL